MSCLVVVSWGKAAAPACLPVLEGMIVTDTDTDTDTEYEYGVCFEAGGGMKDLKKEEVEEEDGEEVEEEEEEEEEVEEEDKEHSTLLWGIPILSGRHAYRIINMYTYIHSSGPLHSTYSALLCSTLLYSTDISDTADYRYDRPTRP